MRLLGNTVLLEPLPVKLVSPGGIHYFERYRDDRMQFRVLAVGPGRVVRKKGRPDVLIPVEVEPGDHCLTAQIHGNKLAFEDGSGRIIIEADEIIAKWRPGSTFAL